MSKDRNFDPKDWGLCGLAKQMLITLIVWVSDQCDAGGNQFGPCGLNEDFALGAIKTNPVISARNFLVLKLCLRDGGSKGDVPEGWCLRTVGLAAL